MRCVLRRCNDHRQNDADEDVVLQGLNKARIASQESQSASRTRERGYDEGLVLCDIMEYILRHCVCDDCQSHVRQGVDVHGAVVMTLVVKMTPEL